MDGSSLSPVSLESGFLFLDERPSKFSFVLHCVIVSIFKIVQWFTTTNEFIVDYSELGLLWKWSYQQLAHVALFDMPSSLPV